MRARLVAVCTIAVLLAACSPDPPSRQDAAAVVQDRCDLQIGSLARLATPRDVFQLSEVARDAFTTMSRTIGELDAEGLSGMDDRAVRRYLRGAIAANDAIADVARTADFEDVKGLRRALDDAESAGDDLDAAAEALDVPDRCGARAWGSLLVGRAAAVADDEVEAMTPTGDLVDDLSTYCSRYRRSIRGAPDQGDLVADRAWAFAVRHGVTLFAERLDELEPPAAQREAFAALVDAVDDTAAALKPAETYAIDGDEERLEDAIGDAEAGLRRVDALVLSLGADC